MPVENIHRDGSLMFNKNHDGGVIADCVTSLTGMIHEDEEFNEDDLDKIKAKDPSVAKHWRYLSDSESKKKLQQQAEADQQAAEDAAARAGVPFLAEGSFEDSTGLKARDTETPVVEEKKATKTTTDKTETKTTDGE